MFPVNNDTIINPQRGAVDANSHFIFTDGGIGVFLKAPVTDLKPIFGLDFVDNTPDSEKPVSGPQQDALDLKADLDSPQFTGDVEGITAAMVGLDKVNNTADADKPVSTAQAAADAAVLGSANATSADAAHITLGLLDGNRLPAISATKNGAVPAAPESDSLRFLSQTGWARTGEVTMVFTMKVFSIQDYNAVGDGVTLFDAVFNGTTTVSSATANFSLKDLGKKMLANEQLVTISSVLDAGTILVDTPINSNASNQIIRYGTDNTAFIQNAVNAAFAQGGGKVWFPMDVRRGKPLPYFVAGPLITSDNRGNNPNSQIYIPSLLVYYQGGPDIPIVIHFEAEVAPGMNEAGFFDIGTIHYNTGTIVQSILPHSMISGVLPSVFGGGALADGFGSITLTEGSYKNMWVRTHNDPVHGNYLTAINNFHLTNFFVEKCRADFDVSAPNSVAPDNICAGFITCMSNGGTMQVIKESTAIGYYVGFSTGEHGNLYNCQSMACLFGVDFQHAMHPTDLYHFTWHWCKYNIGFNIIQNPMGSGTHYLNVWGSVSERVSGGKWYDTVYDVYDPGNNLYGNLIMETVQSGVGPVNSCLKLGGANLNYIWIGDPLNLPPWGGIRGLLSNQTDLQAELDNLQNQINNIPSDGGGSSPVVIPHSESVPFNVYFNLMSHNVSGPLHYTVNTVGKIPGGRTRIRLVADTVNIPTFSDDFILISGTYDNSKLALVNIIDCFYNGSEYEMTIHQAGSAIASIPGLALWLAKNTGYVINHNPGNGIDYLEAWEDQSPNKYVIANYKEAPYLDPNFDNSVFFNANVTNLKFRIPDFDLTYTQDVVVYMAVDFIGQYPYGTQMVFTTGLDGGEGSDPSALGGFNCAVYGDQNQINSAMWANGGGSVQSFGATRYFISGNTILLKVEYYRSKSSGETTTYINGVSVHDHLGQDQDMSGNFPPGGFTIGTNQDGSANWALMRLREMIIVGAITSPEDTALIEAYLIKNNNIDYDQGIADNFETAVVGSAPAGWSSVGNTVTANGYFSALPQGGTQELRVHGADNLQATIYSGVPFSRAATVEMDFVFSAQDGIFNTAGCIQRCASNVASTTPADGYYAKIEPDALPSSLGDPNVEIYLWVGGGAPTQLGKTVMKPGTITPLELYHFKYHIDENDLHTITITRHSDGYYLNSSSDWVVGPASIVTLTDSTITTQGYAGVWGAAFTDTTFIDNVHIY